jgi:hypothetical protein
VTVEELIRRACAIITGRRALDVSVTAAKETDGGLEVTAAVVEPTGEVARVSLTVPMEEPVDRTEINIENIVRRMNELGHPVKADGSLNLVGLRTMPGKPDAFDDWICEFSLRPDGRWEFKASPATLDPGLYWLQNPMRVDGTWITRPGFYPRCWTLGRHKGEYDALVQRASGVFEGTRDRDKDGSPNYDGPIYRDCSGVNMHKAGKRSTIVGKWSAGCWVFAVEEDYEDHMDLVSRHVAEGHGREFDGCLIEWPQGEAGAAP